MRKKLSVLALIGFLVACGQSPSSQEPLAIDYLNRPELQDKESQVIIKKYGQDPLLLQSLQEAYGERSFELKYPEIESSVTPLDLSVERLEYIKQVAWNTPDHYNDQYDAYAGNSQPYAGLNWSRDGCSAPDGLGLGHRDIFRPACYVHDFAYRNLKVYQRTENNRKISDQIFHTNMKAICKTKAWYKRPACCTAAYAYYKGVRVGGRSSFE